MKRIKVIMASYLSPYPNSATNQPEKFIRAVSSFINQSYTNKELIIVSDGCEITNALYDKWFSSESTIRLIKMPKQKIFSGLIRQTGIDSITERDCIICYLDSDDEIMPTHLYNIVTQFSDDLEFVYYNDYIATQPAHTERHVELRMNHIGTSAIAHKNKSCYKWTSSKYGHDWVFVSEYLIPNSNGKHKKINGCAYLIHHIPGRIDN